MSKSQNPDLQTFRPPSRVSKYLDMMIIPPALWADMVCRRIFSFPPPRYSGTPPSQRVEISPQGTRSHPASKACQSSLAHWVTASGADTSISALCTLGQIVCKFGFSRKQIGWDTLFENLAFRKTDWPRQIV